MLWSQIEENICWFRVKSANMMTNAVLEKSIRNLEALSSGITRGILSLIILLFLPVSGSLGGSVSVYCDSQTICALRESAVNLICSYPQIKFSIKAVFWFNFKQKAKWRIETRPEDLALNSDYTGRVTTENKNSSSTLTIRDLRERDSGEYHLMIITEQGEKHLSSAAVSLTVTDLKVEIDRTTPTLFCRTSCSLTSGSQSYIWYKNGQKLDLKNENQDSLIVSSVYGGGSYSCSFSSNEEIRSNAVCVFDNKCWSVTYSDRRVCALEGSSVDFSCTYSYPPPYTVNERFWHYSWFDEQTQDLRQEQQFAGRVEFIEDKERNTLRMRGVRKSDSGEYYFRLISKTPEGRFSGKPGVILNVTDLQVRVISSTDSEEQTVTLMCSSTCTLSNNPTYIWYKNRQPVTNKPTRDNKLDLKCSEDAGSYSCAVRGHEELRSPDQTLCVEGLQESLVLIVVGVVVFLVLIIIILAALWMWMRRSGGCRSSGENGQHDSVHVYDEPPTMAMTSEPTSRVSDNQDNIHYCSVQFKPSPSQKEPPSSKLPVETITEQDVHYSAVNFSRHTAATQPLDAGVDDDPSQLYSQVQHHKPPK